MTTRRSFPCAGGIRIALALMLLAVCLTITACSRPSAELSPVTILRLDAEYGVEMRADGRDDGVIECEVACHGSTVLQVTDSRICRVDIDESGFLFEHTLIRDGSKLSERLEFSDMLEHNSGTPLRPTSSANIRPGSLTIFFQHSFPTPDGIPPVTVTVYRRSDQSYYQRQAKGPEERSLLSRLPIPRIDVTPWKVQSSVLLQGSPGQQPAEELSPAAARQTKP